MTAATRTLSRDLHRQGYDLAPTGTGHYRVIGADGRTYATISGNLRGETIYGKVKADIRRNGGKIK